MTDRKINEWLQEQNYQKDFKMKVEIQEIKVTIDERMSYDIINCLTKALDPFTGKDNYPEAYEFNLRLKSIFRDSVKGIHF